MLYPKVKFKFKGIIASFLPFFILLQLPQIKEDLAIGMFVTIFSEEMYSYACVLFPR